MIQCLCFAQEVHILVESMPYFFAFFTFFLFACSAISCKRPVYSHGEACSARDPAEKGTWVNLQSLRAALILTASESALCFLMIHEPEIVHSIKKTKKRRICVSSLHVQQSSSILILMLILESIFLVSLFEICRTRSVSFVVNEILGSNLAMATKREELEHYLVLTQ